MLRMRDNIREANGFYTHERHAELVELDMIDCLEEALDIYMYTSTIDPDYITSWQIHTTIEDYLEGL